MALMKLAHLGALARMGYQVNFQMAEALGARAGRGSGKPFGHYANRAPKPAPKHSRVTKAKAAKAPITLRKVSK